MSSDTSTKHTARKQPGFFVGYLPFPASLRNFYRLLIPLLLLAAIGAGAFMAAQQEAVGDGVWNPLAATSLSGRLALTPYPVLHMADGNSVLLVVQGKKAADEPVLPFVGKMVTVTGFEIRRGGWHMLEIPAQGAITAAPRVAKATAPARQSFEAVTLQGEIVDSKCFLGVMKPGAGKVHRACAQLCLTGGLPPMLVVNNGESRFGYLLTNADGSSAARQLADEVAVPVSVSGLIERVGDLTYLRLAASPAPVQRLVGQERARFGESIAALDDMPAFCGVRDQDKHSVLPTHQALGEGV